VQELQELTWDMPHNTTNSRYAYRISQEQQNKGKRKPSQFWTYPTFRVSWLTRKRTFYNWCRVNCTPLNKFDTYQFNLPP